VLHQYDRTLDLEGGCRWIVRKRSSFSADVFEIPAGTAAIVPTYESLQLVLGRLTGGGVHPIVAVFAIRTANWRISAHSTLT